MKKNSLIIIFCFLFACKTSKQETIVKAKMIEGKYHGQYSEYNHKGELLVKGYMENGKKSGLWKRYENDSLIRVDRFLNDSLYANLEKDDYLFKTIYSSTIKSNIYIPGKWSINKDFDDLHILLSASKLSDDKIFNPTVVLSFSNLESENILSHVKKEKMSFKNDDSISIIEFKESSIEPNVYYLKYVTSVNSTDIGGLIVWKKIGNKVITFSGNTLLEDMEKYKLLFFNIIHAIE